MIVSQRWEGVRSLTSPSALQQIRTKQERRKGEASSGKGQATEEAEEVGDGHEDGDSQDAELRTARSRERSVLVVDEDPYLPPTNREFSPARDHMTRKPKFRQQRGVVILSCE